MHPESIYGSYYELLTTMCAEFLQKKKLSIKYGQNVFLNSNLPIPFREISYVHPQQTILSLVLYINTKILRY